uniref:Uncharacterized protein n=1 Tax=Timspurckia oligopyrenoides TaxID=708627 RepID=A0A7S0ZL42_9RHOD|mmetsp:Transcript_954/g.1784  ORF Transcript_954/g.1784 Transcript_954/m.1784 type:complete len:112 (+) Transcript_954:75-410(+)
MSSGKHKVYEPVPDLYKGDTDDLWALIQARDQRIREKHVMAAEIRMLSQRISRCYMYAGVNHYEDCAHLTTEYMRLLKEWDKTNLTTVSRNLPDFAPADDPTRKPPPPHPQ